MQYYIEMYVWYPMRNILKYGLYFSQLIRYSRAYGSYDDFIDKGLLLTRKLPNQGFLVVKFKPSTPKFVVMFRTQSALVVKFYM
jgi:hypothetical protein